MTKKFALVILFLSALLSCSTVKEQGLYKVEELNSFFWKVENNNSSTQNSATVYLLGSIHLAKEDMYPLPDNIESAFDSSDALVVEVDLNSVNPMQLMQKAMYSDGRTLESSLSKETYAQLIESLKKTQIPPMLYSKMKPWMAVITVMMLDLTANGFEQSLGIDKHFLDKAGDEKEILQLENADEQLTMLDSGLSQYQEEFVKYSLLDQENTMEQVDSMVQYWKTGNYAEMEKLALGATEEHPEFKPIMDMLYTKRNLKMTAKIEKYLKTDKTYFIVVGAAHLIGKDGIINLLKNK